MTFTFGFLLLGALVLLWWLISVRKEECERAASCLMERFIQTGKIRQALMMPPPNESARGYGLEDEITDLIAIAENVEALRDERDSLVASSKRTEELLTIAQKERERFHLELMEKFGVKERAKLYRTIEDAVRDLRRLRSIEEAVNESRT